jgi:hypothetical protein
MWWLRVAGMGCMPDMSQSLTGRLLCVLPCCCVPPRRNAVPSDMRVLPERIILVRHAQSEGNVNQHTYTYLPDPQVPLVSE